MSCNGTLTGAYDFDLHYTPNNTPAHAASAGGPSLFTALTEQLGLKLLSEKRDVPVLVIDRVEPPSPN